MTTIREVAEQLNILSTGFQIGKLQFIRKEIKGLSKNPGSKIFRNNTISDDGWAFHYGGRKELQFNIGIEEEGLRYGIAFSLEPSQTLPDVSILYPKILKLNCLIEEKPEFFKKYKMWFWKQNRGEISRVTNISPELISPPIFIFIGKIGNREQINYDEILRTFDDLLEIYIAVESDDTHATKIINHEDSFVFSPNNKKLIMNKTYSTKEKEINIDVRHSLLQIALAKELSEKFGENNVRVENYFLGNKIDIVLKINNEFYFYEVKVASSAKACVRQAFGQLLEYAFWPGKRHASKIIIVGEHPLKNEEKTYLSFLQNEFNLPVDYKQINI